MIVFRLFTYQLIIVAYLMLLLNWFWVLLPLEDLLLRRLGSVNPAFPINRSVFDHVFFLFLKYSFFFYYLGLYLFLLADLNHLFLFLGPIRPCSLPFCVNLERSPLLLHIFTMSFFLLHIFILELIFLLSLLYPYILYFAFTLFFLWFQFLFLVEDSLP